MGESPSPSNFESLSTKLHEPLLPPLIAVISGILFVRILGFDTTLALALASVSALLWLLARHKRAPLAALLAGNAIMLWLAVASTSVVESKPKPVMDTEAREVVSVEGCIDSLPQRENSRLFFHFAATPTARLRLSFYLKPDEAAPDWHYGQRLKLPLRLHAIHNSGNPGNFDAERYFGHRDIYWSGSVARGYTIQILDGNCGNAAQSAIYATRTWLLRRVEWVGQGDRYFTAILGALLLGDNAKLEESWTDNYRKTGTYHAIVISGTHITVLAAALFWLLRLLTLRPMQAHVICALMAIGYALVCDLSAPVVRAAGGYLLFLGARHFYRRGRVLNLLAAVAIVYLLADPAQLFEASFQLSFLAVLTLATLAAPLAENTTALWHRALHRLDERNFDRAEPRIAERRLELRLAVGTLSRLTSINESRLQRLTATFGWTLIASLDLFLTSGVVLIGLCLPTILFFHRLTFSSLTANLPVVVLLSLAVPLGFAAILIGPILAPPLSKLLYVSRDVVDWHMSWDKSARIPDPPAWILLALPIALIATAWVARRAPNWVALPIAASLTLFAFLVLHPYSAHPDLRPGLLEITSIDVGQGDALFIATPSGFTALLDAGGSRSPRFDTGESTVSPYLWSRHIAHLDALIASHADQDHMGGLLATLDNFSPRELWVSCSVTGPLWDKLKAKAIAQNVRIVYFGTGDHARLGDLSASVLWPPREEVVTKSNSTSLVLLLEHGQKRFLLTGDIDQSVEARLLDNPALGHLDYLKVAHHGSKTSTSEPFLSRTRPAIAVVSAGYKNSFNHPHPKVLERLQNSHTMLIRTDHAGQISVWSDGQRLFSDSYALRDHSPLAWVPLLQAVE